VSVLEPGAIFGRDFRIVKALRTGGMGAVYVADQISTGKQRALKVMAPELASDPATRERFVREARAASRIESDHVVEIVTAGVDDESDSPFLVMELLRGEELADSLARTGPLPLGDVAEILQQIGHALEQAHQQGIVHRDLKPENIFICASRRRDASFTAKILDFGIAKLVAESQKTGTQPLGTPLFMAPEQTDRKGKICPATDVWALGLIAFRLLTGQTFWLESESLPVLLREICIDPLPFASVRVRELAAAMPHGPPIPALPHGFDAWYARCVNRDIDARFQDAGEAVRAFAELVAVDAPRGVLTVSAGALPNRTSGPYDAMPSAAYSAVQARSGPQARSSTPGGQQVVITGGEGPGAVVEHATVAISSSSTGAPLSSTGKEAAKKGFPVPLIAAPLGIAAVIGVYLLTRGPSTEGSGAPQAVPSARAVSSVASATAPASATPAVAKGSCPEGSVLIPGGKMFMGARDPQRLCQADARGHGLELLPRQDGGDGQGLHGVRGEGRVREGAGPRELAGHQAGPGEAVQPAVQHRPRGPRRSPDQLRRVGDGGPLLQEDRAAAPHRGRVGVRGARVKPAQVPLGGRRAEREVPQRLRQGVQGVGPHQRHRPEDDVRRRRSLRGDGAGGLVPRGRDVARRARYGGQRVGVDGGLVRALQRRRGDGSEGAGHGDAEGDARGRFPRLHGGLGEAGLSLAG